MFTRNLRLKTIVIVLTAILLTAVVSGCCDTKGGSRGKTGIQQDDYAVIEVVEREGVRLTLGIEKAVYHPGEKVKAVATVENLNKSPVIYWVANLQDPPIYVVLDTDFLGSYHLRGPDDPEMVNPMETTGMIAPQETAVREVSWDQMVASGIQAPSNQYTVRAHLTLAGADTGLRTHLEVTTTFAVEGSYSIIPPEEALMIAFEHPEVKVWYEANGGVVVCRLYGNRVVTLENGELQEASNSEFGEQEHNGRPICGPGLGPGPTWQVGFVSKTGAAPGEIQVSLDATSGDVLEVQFTGW